MAAFGVFIEVKSACKVNKTILLLSVGPGEVQDKMCCMFHQCSGSLDKAEIYHKIFDSDHLCLPVYE